MTRMGVLAASILAATLTLGAAPAWAAAGATSGTGGTPAGPSGPAFSTFVTGTEDLPLMAGLREVLDRGVVFESPNGRIVEAWAVGYLSADRVRGFYRDSLPQLGWRAVGDMTFRREGEVLTLDFPSGTGDPLAVRFRIAPDS